MHWKGLKKVEGKSYEDIIVYLEERNIEYASSPPKTRYDHFKESTISIVIPMSSRSEERIESPWLVHQDFLETMDWDFNNNPYHRAFYELDDSFRIERLTGKYMFDKGRLVEKIWLDYDFPPRD